MAASGTAQCFPAFARRGKITNFMRQSPLTHMEQRKRSLSVDSESAAEFAKKTKRYEPEAGRIPASRLAAPLFRGPATISLAYGILI
jgi:hypothetical protein